MIVPLPKFGEKSVKVENVQVRMAVAQLANGVLIFVSDSDYRIGTIAVGVPSPFGEVSPTATSCVVGTRFQSAARALAEIAAQKFKGIVIVNLYVSKENEALITIILAAVRDLLPKF